MLEKPKKSLQLLEYTIWEVYQMSVRTPVADWLTTYGNICGKYLQMLWQHLRVHIVPSKTPSQHHQPTFWIKIPPNHLQATTPQLAIGKLLFRLNIEDSSLEHVSVSILITSLPEIWKKSLDFASPLFALSLLSGSDLLLFAHLSPNQPTALLMGLSIFCPASNCRNWAVSLQILHLLPSLFDLYHRQIAYANIILFRSQHWNIFRHFISPQQRWGLIKALLNPLFLLRLDFHLVLTEQLLTVLRRTETAVRVCIVSCCCVLCHSRNTEMLFFFCSWCSTGFGRKKGF